MEKCSVDLSPAYTRRVQHSEYDDVQTLTVETALPNVSCLACSFSVEALLEAVHVGTFQFCRAHMVRALSYGEEMFGERPLHAVP